MNEISTVNVREREREGEKQETNRLKSHTFTYMQPCSADIFLHTERPKEMEREGEIDKMNYQ